MRALPLLSLLLAAPAAAEPLATTREAAIHERTPPVDLAIRPARLHLDWTAGATLAAIATRDDAAATAGVDAEATLAHGPYDLVVVGGQLDARAGDDAPLAAQQWVRLSPVRGLHRLTLGHHLAWDVRPTLLAPPRARPGLSRTETISIGFEGLSVIVNDPGPLALVPVPAQRLQLARMDVDLSIGWTTDDATYLDSSARARMAFIGYREDRADGGEPLQVWVFATGVDAVTPSAAAGVDASAMTASFDVVQITGARVAGGRLELRAGMGMHASTGATVDEHADALSFAPFAGYERDVAGGSWRVSAGRTHWPLWDGTVVVDDRLTVGAARSRGRLHLRGEAFGARSHRLALGPSLTHATTGGVTALAEWTLSDHATVRVRGDAGRAFYAAGASLDDPRWAGEVLATLAVRAGSR